jgi:hypothetical protein
VFSFKEAAAIGVKGARGLVGDAYALRPGTFQIVADVLLGLYTSLKPGEDTTVSVPVDDLPANADVKSITARLHVTDASDTGPQPPPNSVTVTRDGTATTLHVNPGVISRPRNVTVRLDRGEPIWSFADTLVKGEYDLPDFAQQLNAYLDKATVSGSRMTLNFLVKSDTPGSVKITILRKDVTRLQTQTWTNDLDQTVRMDRNVQVNFGDFIAMPLDALAAGGNATVKGVKLDVAGTFGPERLLGAVRPHAGRDYATISADYSIAQQVVLETDVQAAGVSGYVAADADAELYMELQPDQNGVPAADAQLASATVTLAAGKSGTASWIYGAFASPASMSTGTPCWIVLKAVKGAVRLGLETGGGTYLGPLMVNRTGRLWKPFAAAGAALASLLRIVYLPGVDNQSAGLVMAVRGAASQAVDPGPTPRTIALTPGASPPARAVIDITSHAHGALTVANVIQEY